MSTNGHNRPASLAEVAQVLDELPGILRAARRMRGLALRDVAEQSGVSFNALSRYERNMDLSLANVRLLLTWLGGK